MIDSIEERGLTATIGSAYQDDRTIACHLQVQVQVAVSLVILYVDTFQFHDFLISLRAFLRILVTFLSSKFELF